MRDEIRLQGLKMLQAAPGSGGLLSPSPAPEASATPGRRQPHKGLAPHTVSSDAGDVRHPASALSLDSGLAAIGR